MECKLIQREVSPSTNHQKEVPMKTDTLRVHHAVAWLLITAALILGTLVIIHGCERRSQLTQPAELSVIDPFQFEATGEDFLISAIDEIQAIADWNNFDRAGSTIIPGSRSDKAVLSKTATDTVYIYGEVTPDGYGAVVTERHTYPKGLLLITVRKSYGNDNGRIVSQTKRYISYADFVADNPQQSNVTEIFALSADTIVTRVLRNGTLETFTFRLPVITRTTNLRDGSVRVTSRYGANGQIISEIADGGLFVQRRKNWGEGDGSLVTRTESADSTWTLARTRGQEDGTILREVITGFGF